MILEQDDSYVSLILVGSSLSLDFENVGFVYFLSVFSCMHLFCQL